MSRTHKRARARTVRIVLCVYVVLPRKYILLLLLLPEKEREKKRGLRARVCVLYYNIILYRVQLLHKEPARARP